MINLWIDFSIPLSFSWYWQAARQIYSNGWIKIFLLIFVWAVLSANIVPKPIEASKSARDKTNAAVVATITNHYTHKSSKIERTPEIKQKFILWNKKLLLEWKIDKAVAISLEALLRSWKDAWLWLITNWLLIVSYIIINIDWYTLLLLFIIQLIAVYQTGFSILDFTKKLLSSIRDILWKMLRWIAWKWINAAIIVWLSTLAAFYFRKIAIIALSIVIVGSSMMYLWTVSLWLLLMIAYQTIVIHEILLNKQMTPKTLVWVIKHLWNKLHHYINHKIMQCFRVPLFWMFILFWLFILKSTDQYSAIFDQVLMIWLVRALLWIVWFLRIRWLRIMLSHWWFYEIEAAIDDSINETEPLTITNELYQWRRIWIQLSILMVLYLVIHYCWQILPSTGLWKLMIFWIKFISMMFLTTINGIWYTNLKEMYISKLSWKDKLKFFYDTPVGVG